MAQTPKPDIGESIYFATCRFIDERTQKQDKLLRHWLTGRNFALFAHLMVHIDAENCWTAGAIALARKNDPAKAFDLWKLGRRNLDALNEGVKVRAALPADTQYDSMGESDTLPARYFYCLFACLLYSGDRSGLARLRGFFDLPFVVINGSDPKRPDSMAAEIRLAYAAWEGDTMVADGLASALQPQRKRFKIADVYSALWQAVARRDEKALDKLLPEAQAARKAANRRGNMVIWGGAREYNKVMFDTYTTCVLKIARETGMRWTYGNAETEELWPEEVLSKWEA